MNNSVRVQVFEGIDNLHGVALNLQFMKSLPPLEQLIHALIVAELEQDINIVAIFEKMHKLGHIAVLDGPMNLDLTHELLLGPAPLQRGLLNNLGRGDGLGLALDKFVALCKSTFAQELSFHVLSIRYLPILMLDSFLDYLGGGVAWLSRSHQVCLTTTVLWCCYHWLRRGDPAAGTWSSRLSTTPVKRSLTIVIRHIF